MIAAADIMRRVAIIIHDEDNVRWPLPELAEWINEGVRAVCLAKPSAASKKVVMPLIMGTLQNLPKVKDSAGDEWLSLIKITRNITDSARPELGGRIITIIDEKVLDAQMPNWHERNHLPFTREVRSYIYDESNPYDFYVYPGNDGTGQVEAIVGYCPPSVVPTGDVEKINSWGGNIGLPEPYSVPLVDYTIARALLKDDVGGDMGRASAHWQLFQAAIGLKIEVEGAHSPNAKRLAGA